MPVVTMLGLVGNSLSILVLHTPGVDMKVSLIMFGGLTTVGRGL